MKIHGWGNYSAINAQVLKPKKINDVQSFITNNDKIIARGLGRSYGDSANNSFVVDTTNLNKITKFDKVKGLITCESGVSINEINKIIIPNGWFMPVTPGSSYITIGGAVASDVHGKNHHLEGTFSNHILFGSVYPSP